MTTVDSSLSSSVAGSIHDFSAAEWDALAGEDNPFIEHRFLAALEDSGSLGEGSGWQPSYLAVRGQDDALQAAAPTYLRSDSYGEYIFDWGWARACQRSGISYYPKLTAAVPYTPATGPRLLVHPSADPETMRALLGRTAVSLAQQTGCSSVHWLFCREEEARALTEHGYLLRQTFQYHWHNRGWASFEAFLADLSRKRRGEIGRERRRIRDAGVDIELLLGTDLEEEHWQALESFYRRTIARMGGIPYLKPTFFLEFAPANLAERVIAVLAKQHGKWIAGSLSFAKGKHLYGRYWGCSERIAGLHFELCYHRLIEYAIDTGKTLFEAGAQGDHKVHRGLLPKATWSAHWLGHPGLREAVSEHLDYETREVQRHMDWLREHGPFKDNRSEP